MGESGLKGVIPTARGESLSSRDRGMDNSGIVLTSGMQRRVLRKWIKLAKPKLGSRQLSSARLTPAGQGGNNNNVGVKEGRGN
jgi:hypothetical protein